MTIFDHPKIQSRKKNIQANKVLSVVFFNLAENRINSSKL